MKDLDILITKNGRYIMIENMIYDKVLDRHGDINNASFSDLIDIIGENVAFLAQDIKTDLKEISSFTRKNVYHVLECFGETDKKLSLMMEYEVKFGSSLLTESVTNPKAIVAETWGWIKEQVTILEQTYNPFNKDFWSKSNAKQIGSNVVSGAKSAAKSVVDTSKSIGKAVGNAVLHPIDTIKKGYNWVKENGLGALMEKIRDGLYSGVGTAIQIFLQFTGVGNVAVAIVWGAMLVYDLYKVFSGKEWSWTDILFDVLGMISGAAVKVLKGGMKVAGITKSMPMAKGVQTLAANPATKGFMATIGKGISTVFNLLKKSGNWLAQKLGLKWVSGVMTKAENWLAENLLKPIGNAVGLKGVGNKMLGKTDVTLGSATRKATAGGTAYQVKSDYIYQPGMEQAGKLIDKVKGVKPVPAVAPANTFGLADDVSDQLDAAFG
jgi:hypothetical protein